MGKPSFRMAVTAPQLDADKVRVALLAALRKSAKSLQGEFEKTTKTWNGGGPIFETQIGLSQGEGANLDIALTGDEQEKKKWFWLNEGTKVRYATMSPDWQSKTTPRVVGSTAGRGKVLFVNKKYPRPGIEAREWTKIIKKEFKPEFRADMKAALAAGLKASKKR